VLATYAELAEEIDLEAARERLAEAERVASDDDAVAATEIAKAQARIAVAG
jgi:F0F1-type ATP synthase epsilon subunit